MKRSVLFLAFALGAFAPLSAQELRTVPVHRYGIIADSVGTANLVAADLTGDGRPEIVSCSNGAPFALQYAGNNTYSVWWQGPAVGCRAVTVGDRNGDGAPEVLVLAQNTGYNSPSDPRLLIFDPRSLGAPITTVPLPGTASYGDIAIGSVDADPWPEIVVVSTAATYVYDGITLALQWTANGYGGVKLALGDVDGDARKEIVVNGSSGSVLDAEAQTLKWGYVGGFGTIMAVGNVDADAKDEIVFSSSYNSRITILNGDTFTTSTITGDWYYDALAVGDGDNDGVNEIVTGANQWGDIAGRRSTDGAVLWKVNNPEHGVQAVTVADADGDGKKEAIWGAGLSSSGRDALFIADPIAKTIEWSSPDLDGPFGSAVGDLDGDGRPELLIGTTSTNSGYSGGSLEVFDAATYASKGSFALPNNSYFGYNTNGKRVLIGQLDADPAKEVLVYPQLQSFDGVTRQSEWIPSGNQYNGPYLNSPPVIANVDADPTDEIIVGESDSKVIVLHGASNIIQASIPVSGTVVDLAITDFENDGTLDLIVGTTTTLYLFNTSNWSIRGQVALTGIARVAGMGDRIAVGFISSYGGPGVRLYGSADLQSVAWTWSGLNTYESISALTFANVGGARRLLAGTLPDSYYSAEGARLLTFADLATATPVSRTVGRTIFGLNVTDATGDGVPDLMIDAANASEIDLLGFSTDLRGDATGDTLITGSDADAIADYVFGPQPGARPTADVNADQRISVEDVFSLIGYLYSGGAAPQP